MLYYCRPVLTHITSDEEEAESPLTKSCDGDGDMHWDSSNASSDPLNTSMYQGIDEGDESESEFNITSIINTINMNAYNNIKQVQHNNVNGINYIINNNNINNITNFNTTNNVHTVNNINPKGVLESPVLVSGFKHDYEATSASAPCTPRDKKARFFTRTTAHHKRRGSDTDASLRLEEKYQRRHSEGKVIRIAGIRDQVIPF